MSEFSTDQKLVFGGSAITVVGALLPWIGGVGSFDAAGIELTREIAPLFFGLLVAGLLYVADWTATAQLIAAVLGALVIGVAGYTLLESFELLGDVSITAGVGVYVTILGGLVVLGGGLRAYTESEPEAGMYSHR